MKRKISNKINTSQDTAVSILAVNSPHQLALFVFVVCCLLLLFGVISISQIKLTGSRAMLQTSRCLTRALRSRVTSATSACALLAPVSQPPPPPRPPSCVVMQTRTLSEATEKAMAGPGIGTYEEVEKVLPRNYSSILDAKQTQHAIASAKEYIEKGLCEELNLFRVECPLMVDEASGLNDMLDRDGSRTPVRFFVKNDHRKHPVSAQVQSSVSVCLYIYMNIQYVLYQSKR